MSSSGDETWGCLERRQDIERGALTLTVASSNSPRSSLVTGILSHLKDEEVAALTGSQGYSSARVFDVLTCSPWFEG